MKHLKLYTLLIASAFFIGCSEDDPAPATPPTGSVVESITGETGSEITFTGEFADAQGLKSILIENAELGLNITVDPAGAKTYSMSEAFTISAEQERIGDYGAQIKVTNISDLTEIFITTVTVTEPVCQQEVSVFHDATTTSDHKSTWEDYTEWEYGVTEDINISISGDQLTITGDFIWWWATTATATIVENPATPGVGTLDWGTEPIYLVDHDSYYDDGNYYEDAEAYMVVNDTHDPSTYNSCDGVITINFDFMFNDCIGCGTDDLVLDATVWTVLTINE